MPGYIWDGSASDEIAARKYHSITVGSYNTWTDWRLIPSERPVAAPPEPKTNLVDVPGADGVLDFTESLDGQVHYKMREGSWTFFICHEQIDIDTGNKYHSENRWSEIYHRILNAIHGKRNSVLLLDEWKDGAADNRLYVGRVWVSTWKSDPNHSKITLDYSLEPFRYLTEADARDKVNGVL